MSQLFTGGPKTGPPETYLLPSGNLSFALRKLIFCPPETYLLPSGNLSFALRKLIFCPPETYLLPSGNLSFALRNLLLLLLLFLPSGNSTGSCSVDAEILFYFCLPGVCGVPNRPAGADMGLHIAHWGGGGGLSFRPRLGGMHVQPHWTIWRTMPPRMHTLCSQSRRSSLHLPCVVVVCQLRLTVGSRATVWGLCYVMAPPGYNR